MSEKIIEIKDLKINFKREDGIAEVINHVNLHVNKEEVVAIVGESGCGKSVTVRSMMGLLPTPPAQFEDGEILFEDNDLVGLSERAWHKIRGKKISMIFQDPMTALNPVFTIGQQLIDVYLLQGKSSAYLLPSKQKKQKKIAARERAIELLKKMRIPDPESILDRYPVELSGGMRQRVLIALSLIQTPDLLIADEPGTALDVSVQDQILAELKRLVKEEHLSMIFITHNLGVARMISDRIYVMYSGEVIETAVSKDLFENPLHPYTKGLLDSIPKLNGEMGEGISGRLPNLVNPPEGCRFYDRCPVRLKHCKTIRPELKEVSDGHSVACHLFDEGEKL